MDYQFLNDFFFELIQEHGLKPVLHALIAARNERAKVIAASDEEPEVRDLEAAFWQADAACLESVEAKLLSD
jgi:hypothetical protein